MNKNLNYKLVSASKLGNVEELICLIKLGADATAEGSEALYCAACNGHDEVVRLLLGAGAKL